MHRKGTVPWDFGFQVFSWISFPQAPEYHIRAVSNLFEILGDIRSSRCTTVVVDTIGKWKKSSIRKVLIILFVHPWEVELACRYIFFFKFTLRCKQSDNVPIICHWCQIYRRCRTGGNLPLVSLALAANLPLVSLTPVANLLLVSTTLAVAKFATVSLILVVHLDLLISPRFCQKNLQWP